MSISFNVYARESKPVSRSELAAKCRDLHWLLLIRDASNQYVRPKGMLSDGDQFYGADSRRMAESELKASLESNRWDSIHATSGGEAIVAINANFSIHDVYDADGFAELTADNEQLAERLRNSKVQMEISGGSYFALQLSESLARLYGGVWEDPQNGDWELM